MPLKNMSVSKWMLVLGSSGISEESYLQLASDLGESFSDMYALIWSRALNPADTSEFVKSIANEPNKDELIYMRAIKCVDEASLIIVDISQASTGMGLEVGYLLSQLKEQEKCVVFIAKKGSKLSPHITGMYKHVTGKECEVTFYDEEKDMMQSVRNNSEFKEYYEAWRFEMDH